MSKHTSKTSSAIQYDFKKGFILKEPQFLKVTINLHIKKNTRYVMHFLIDQFNFST